MANEFDIMTLKTIKDLKAKSFKDLYARYFAQTMGPGSYTKQFNDLLNSRYPDQRSIYMFMNALRPHLTVFLNIIVNEVAPYGILNMKNIITDLNAIFKEIFDEHNALYYDMQKGGEKELVDQIAEEFLYNTVIKSAVATKENITTL
ncbi:MAG: hypothetical protein ACI4L6_00855 [Candidatus Onthoplasma sp.]